jgi:hypothetical protein
MENKFNDTFNKIILECKENKIISEGFFRKLGGALKTKSGKNKMMKDSIIKWLNANKISQADAENKFSGTLPNGYTIKFTFRPSEWNDPKATQITYAIYLRDEEGNSIALDKKGVIDYGYSEADIKKELTSKLSVALEKGEAKAAFTTKKAIDKSKVKARKAEEKAATAEKAAAEREAQAQRDAEELSE